MNNEKEVHHYERAANDALEEVKKAKAMYPHNFFNQHEAIAVLWEEVDELWDEVKKNQRNYDLKAQRKEAIQVAAMAIRFAAELTFEPVLEEHLKSQEPV